MKCNAYLAVSLDNQNCFGGKNAEEVIHTRLQVGKKNAVLVDLQGISSFRNKHIYHISQIWALAQLMGGGGPLVVVALRQQAELY